MEKNEIFKLLKENLHLETRATTNEKGHPILKIELYFKDQSITKSILDVYDWGIRCD